MNSTAVALADKRVNWIFLDRDGTINFDSGYLSDPDTLKLLPDVSNAIADLRNRGFKIAIVSNQSGIGRGLVTVEQVELINQRLSELLLEENSDAQIDEIFYCPHHPDDNCECRKPETAMLDRLLPYINLQGSWMVGDKLSDLQFGINLGLSAEHCVLLASGEGIEVLPQKCRVLKGIFGLTSIV